MKNFMRLAPGGPNLYRSQIFPLHNKLLWDQGNNQFRPFSFLRMAKCLKEKILISIEKVLGSMAGNLGKALGFGDPRFEAL